MSSMTRSRKTSGKATAKQNQQEIKQIQGILNEIVNAVTNDIARLNGLVYAMLKANGQIKEVNCPSCKQVLFEPTIEGIPKTEVCPACGEALNVDEQMKIDDFQNWDEGKSSEEE